MTFALDERKTSGSYAEGASRAGAALAVSRNRLHAITFLQAYILSAIAVHSSLPCYPSVSQLLDDNAAQVLYTETAIHMRSLVYLVASGPRYRGYTRTYLTKRRDSETCRMNTASVILSGSSSRLATVAVLRRFRSVRCRTHTRHAAWKGLGIVLRIQDSRVKLEGLRWRGKRKIETSARPICANGYIFSLGEGNARAM